MKMKYKIVLIVLILLVLLTFDIIRYQQYKESQYIEFNGVKISYEDYNKAKEAMKDYADFQVIDVETGNRIRFIEIQKIIERIKLK
jgi:hypothetical protein